MEVWMTQIGKLLTWMLGNPSSQVEQAVLIIAGILTFLLVLTKVGDLLGVGISTTGRSLAVLAISLIAWFALSAAALIYVAPTVPAEAVRWIPVAAVALVVLAISAPLTRLFQKAKYGKGLVLVLLSVGAAVAVILLAGAAFGAAREGGKEGARLKERTSEVNRLPVQVAGARKEGAGSVGSEPLVN